MKLPDQAGTTAHTFATPSHRCFLTEHFLPSWLATQSMPLTVHQLPQECESGSFMDPGWNSTMVRKLGLIIDALDGLYPFWHLDADIRFYEPLRPEWDCDIAMQRDREGPCCGMFWIRPSDRTRTLFARVLEAVKYGKAANDQIALWQEARHIAGLTIRYLPDTYWTHGARTGQIYEPGVGLSGHIVPAGLVAHHGNYAVGVLAKMRLLSEVADHQSSHAN